MLIEQLKGETDFIGWSITANTRKIANILSCARLGKDLQCGQPWTLKQFCNKSQAPPLARSCEVDVEKRGTSNNICPDHEKCAPDAA